MVYVAGIIGLIGGFALGQLLLYFLLRGRSTQELLSDKNLKWKYGLFNWLIAGLGSYSAVFLYNLYFA